MAAAGTAGEATAGGAAAARAGLALAGIAKRYDGRAVLEGVGLAVEAGRVRALVGENGAGKSTLIKVACGLVAPDAGAVRVDGEALPPDAREAIRRGVGVVHQHFMLVEPMTVADNVALGAEPRTGPFGLWVDRARARATVRELGEKYGLAVDPDAKIEDLAVGERQRVELLKVLYRGARYVLLDEPTAVLSPGEVRALLDVIRGLARGGAGVLLVSHKLDEVLAVADDVTVLRRGRVVLEKSAQATDAGEIARAVVGGELREHAAGAAAAREGEGLVVRDATAPGLRGVSLAVRPGEVLGVAGVEGNGQRPLAHAIAGLLPLERGSVRVAGDDVSGLDVAARRARGLGFVPEDREGTGLLAGLSITENLALGDAGIAAGSARLSQRAARERARALIEKYGVRPPDPDALVGTLSGGNAQKVLIARELSRTLRALVVAQPTRGVDLGAAVEVHAAIAQARADGVAVLLVTSELEELRKLSDRVVVMRAGAVVGEMPVADATDERLGELMVGGGAA